MACSDVVDMGRSLQIIHITREENDNEITHGLKLNQENLERVMLNPDVKNNPVVIVSIAGALRKGKSFLLGFFLKYLEANAQGKKECDWLKKEDKIKGFEWRGGSDQVTSGIHIWSKPFVFQNKSGKRVAVLLMDTQGVFDETSTVHDCARIFALSGLMSSVQIYNLMQQLQEDDLQHLELFTEFGKLITDITQEEKRSHVNKSKLVFLIRDWAYPYEHDYGKDGGEAYITKKLEIKETQPKELKRIRENLDTSFSSISGFLLPHPGKAVATKKSFNGLVEEIDDEFVDMVKLLVLYILSDEMLVTKQINNMDVTGEDLLFYVEVLVKHLKTGDYPIPQTAFMATAEVGRHMAVTAAFKFYKEGMEKVVGKKVLCEEELEMYHKKHNTGARDKLKTFPRMLLEEYECECVEKLDDLVNIEFIYLKQINDKKKRERMEAILIAAGTSTLAGAAAVAAFVFKK